VYPLVFALIVNLPQCRHAVLGFHGIHTPHIVMLNETDHEEKDEQASKGDFAKEWLTTFGER
jgi:hypothetical protein